MNKTLVRLITPGFRLYFSLCLLFAAATAFFSPPLAAAEALVSLGLYFYLQRGMARRKREIVSYIETMYDNLDAASQGTMLSSPMPMVIFRPETEDIIWSNDGFLALTGDRDHIFDVKLRSLVPDFDADWLLSGESHAPEPIFVRGRRYQVYGNLLPCAEEDSFLALTYWVDVTRWVDLAEAYDGVRPMVGILLIDNYEELVRGIEGDSRSALLGEINRQINLWAEESGGLLFRYDRDHYLFLFETRYLAAYQQKKFAVLDAVRAVQSKNGISASLSLGLGRDAENFRDLLHFASLALEMALARGGDQVVIKDTENFQFFGGRARETERRTKVKSRVMANALSELLSNADNILVQGHKFADLDVVGAAVGICALARARSVPCHVYREPEQTPALPMIRRLAALPEYQNTFIDAEAALALAGKSSILVVVDTNRPEQLPLPELLQLCPRVVVIDHHRRAASYITGAVLSFHDPYASSASELAAELVQYSIDPSQLLRQEAESILAGIVLDTKNFTARTGTRTFETAAFLRRLGADTAEVKKIFQNNLPETVARYDILRQASIYRGSLAMAVLREPVSRIAAAQAADELLNVAGITASFVLFPDGQGQVLLSARSTGEVNVQVIAEGLGGGGNAATAGAQLGGVTPQEAADQLQTVIDAYFAEETAEA